MRSGSSAHDGDGWPSAQNPYRDDAMSGPGPYGPGRRSEPREVPDGRREVPFGPDVSWPNGFRQLDTETQRCQDLSDKSARDCPDKSRVACTQRRKRSTPRMTCALRIEWKTSNACWAPGSSA